MARPADARAPGRPRARRSAVARAHRSRRPRAGEHRRRADPSRMPLTVGTAGHIDHGKTWLVRALTGKDTDRLPEEQRRGISIDLGYAPLELPDGRRLSLVDVPGHERFVRNMVAGATGIDLFLLVIDAAEGARPQTHEHLAILRLLGIDRGVTGTLWSGTVGEGDELRVEPAGLDVRVRSVQVHDRAVERAEAGQRVAVALPGVERDRLARGDALIAPDSYPTTFRLDVALEELDDVPAALTVHLGTADVPARVARHGRFAQLRLARPVVAARG